MEITELIDRFDLGKNTRLSKAYIQLEKLIHELRNRELPDEIVDFININIGELNSISGKQLKSEISKKQSRILGLIEKELKIVPKNHYRNMWLSLGIAAFGVPIGVAVGVSIGKMAFLGIGISVGMLFGIVIGSRMDKKAVAEGRQLELEIIY